MSSLQSFLDLHKVVKGSEFTHTSLSGGSFYIPVEDEDTFFELYTKELMIGKPLHLTEKQRDSIVPIIIDLDFRQESPNLNHKYTDVQLRDIISCLMNVIDEYLYLPEDVHIFVLTKPARQEGNIVKDGIHIIVPEVVAKKEFHSFLRNSTYKTIGDILQPCSYTNTPMDIYDNIVGGNKNWLLYGSKKPKEPSRWSLSYLYSYSSGMIEQVETSLYTESQLPEILSIRNKYRTLEQKLDIPEVKEIKQKEDDNLSMTSMTSAVSTVVTETTNIDHVFINKLVSILSKDRADIYDKWIRVGWCLHNIEPSSTLLQYWIDFSKKSSKFKHGECENLWYTMRNEGLQIGTLCKWAKEDNPIEYAKLIKQTQNALLDRSLSGTHSDIAKAAHMMFKDKYVCGTFNKSPLWFEFRGNRWVCIQSAYTFRLDISNTFSNAYAERAKYYKSRDNMEMSSKLIAQSKKLQMVSFKDSIMRELAEYFYNPEFMNRLDTKINLLCFNNGIYDLNEHIFRPGKIDDYITMSTNYNYSYEDDKDIQDDILKFISSIMADETMVEYLLKVLAYMLHGDKYMELLWFFTGKGRNGKGTLCTLLKNAFGDYYYEPDITIVTTTKKSSSAASPEMMKAKGRRLLVSSEPDDDDIASKFRVNKLKQLRGNDLIQARGLYMDFFEFKPQFGMIFQMNDKPELSKVDDAISKSLKILDFPYQFVHTPVHMYQRQIDMSLKQKFENVKYVQQFMRILLSYHKEYINGNKVIEDPESVIQATREYMEDCNPVAHWLKSNYEITNNSEDRVKVDDLYSDFHPKPAGFNKKKFGQYMGYLGFKSKTCQYRYYTGLKKQLLAILEDEIIN